jgi:type IV secretion system protein VirB9
MKRRAFFLLAVLTLATAAHAAQEPVPSKGDPRIRYVDYDPNNVVLLYSKVGASLLIQFEQDEKLVDMVGGDVDAWGAASTQAKNGIFLKPAGVAPETNIQVITNRRTYNFEVKLAPKGKPNYLTVRFRYPATEHAVDMAAKESDQVRSLLEAGNPAGNRRYTVQGSNVLAPIEAWDDGRTTYLRFRAHSSIPAVYGPRAGEDDDAMAEIKNVPVKDDVVQVPGVHRKLMLIVGKTMACVFNEAFDINAPRPATNTASPYVQRTLKGDEK